MKNMKEHGLDSEGEWSLALVSWNGLSRWRVDSTEFEELSAAQGEKPNNNPC
jgi:hypothetical protein